MREQNENNTINAISNYLSLLQLKYDCETVGSLVPTLKRDGILVFGLTPYFSLTVASAIEFLEFSPNGIPDELDILKIQDVRLKLKVFEASYSKSKRMILNIDFLQDQIFKNELAHDFMKNWNIHYNLGIYTDSEKRVLSNTQYNYYMTQDNRLLKKKISEIATLYSISPQKFNLNEQTGKDLNEYGRKCGQMLGSVRSGLSKFDSPVEIVINNNHIDYYFADYNSNLKTSLFPTGEDGKGVVLYLLHTLSTINILLYALNGYEKDDYGWWLKANYISYYYAIHKLRDLHQYLLQNRLLTPDISDYFTELGLDDAKYLSSNFRNYVMHSKLTDKNGKMLINTKELDKGKPLFGLVESCFEGLSYEALKKSIKYEMTKISDILAQWLGTQNLNIQPL